MCGGGCVGNDDRCSLVDFQRGFEGNASFNGFCHGNTSRQGRIMVLDNGDSCKYGGMRVGAVFLLSMLIMT